MYGIWNLDFFRTLVPHICLQVNTLKALVLDYAIGFISTDSACSDIFSP